MLLQTLIFDLDGTLIDSAPDLRSATNKLLSTYERRAISMEEVKLFVGNGAPKLIERSFKATGESARVEDIPRLTEEFLAFYEGHEADETLPYDGVIDTLRLLKNKGYQMALCTNKPQAPTHNLLTELGMDTFFDVVLGGDQLDRKKPDPQMVLWVLDQLNCAPEDAVMIGDSANDIEGAKNAKVRSIAVSYGYRQVPIEDLNADCVVDHFNELPGALKRPILSKKV